MRFSCPHVIAVVEINLCTHLHLEKKYGNTLIINLQDETTGDPTIWEDLSIGSANPVVGKQKRQNKERTIWKKCMD